ncbi:GNAT family N-acetyltransferase [Candidatus Thorarchaeota archaeon]|nr:MAG: GNAT family N-acetyltransferase [Candidatus Thorarchaeota archaeon]
MRYLGEDDPDFDDLREQIISHVAYIENRNQEYWIVADESPLLVVTLRTEPSHLLAPVGTRLGHIHPVVEDLDPDDLPILHNVLRKLGRDENLMYLVYDTVADRHKRILGSLLAMGFEIFDTYVQMMLELDEEFPEPEGLEFIPVKTGKRSGMLELQVEFYAGSGDETTKQVMKTVATLPQESLDIYYDPRASFLAERKGEVVGLVGVGIQRELLSSMAVSPKHRGKGYGRKILHHALNRMRELGCSRCYLRVHSDNTPAMRLYESLGFEVIRRGVTAILWLGKHPNR